MKIVDSRESSDLPNVPEFPEPGRVYQLTGDGIYKGDLHIADWDGRLICLRSGELWSIDGFGIDGAKAFRDVTDYVFVDASQIPR
jgi:hypothetical protein